MPYTRLIKNLSKFYTFTDDEMTSIIQLVKIQKIRKRQMFIKAGDVSRKLAFVNKGLFKSYFTNSEGVEHIIQLSQEDFWLVDMQSYITAKASLSSIECIDEAELYCFDFEDIENLFVKIPRFESHFRLMLQNRIISLHNDRYNLISLSAEERYISFLNQNPEMSQRISQKDIASFLGIFPESLSRIRRHIANKL
jgi:CRP/FNR family transcriptional regulator, anaerobic regulatory protein